MYAVPVGVATAWYALAPAFVAASNPRIRQRNPDHYARMVRFSRVWGGAAVVVGFAVAFVR